MIKMRKSRKQNTEKSDSPSPSTPIEKVSAELLQELDHTQKSLSQFYTDIANIEEPTEYTDEVETQLASYKRANQNILKAYYHSVSMSDELGARWRELKKKKRKHFWRAPSNSTIDLREMQSNHFAKGMNLYKILLVCYIGSFVGVVVEMIWCLLTNGYLESRAGLVWGPFNLLYGVGAVAMTLALYHFRNHGKWILFIGGFIVGSVVEYGCSLVQELLFGSVSWDYSHMPFNINGRICLLYSVFWGILGILWMKSIYPWMAKFILRIPNKVGKIVTWIFFAFFVLNVIVSAVAVFRWSQRLEMVAPTNAFWELIDAWFPNETMEKIYANMRFK